MFTHHSADTELGNAGDERASQTREHLTHSDIDGVQSFLMFIGWPRSCHSIIGSMLDAHPNVIVAHEFFLFKKLRQNPELSLNRSQLYKELYRNSYKSVKRGWRTLDQSQKGYNLNMDGAWQGRFTHLKVIGDKSGGRAALVYHEHSCHFKELYQQLAASVKVPMKVLQVIRNPLDMIATEMLYRGSSVAGRKARATVRRKYSNAAALEYSTAQILNISRAIMRMVPDVGLSPLEVHCEDLIADPAKTVSHICQFLDVECSADYLQMCVDKTFRNVSESRHLVNWDPHTLHSLIDTLLSFPFFQRYAPSMIR